MSQIFPVPHSDRTSGPYVATDGQTDFTGTFPIQFDYDVQVLRKRGGISTTLVLDTDYQVAGSGNAAGFTVMLIIGATAADEIQLVGLAELSRTTSVVQAGQFNSRQMDREFDRNRIIDQELRRDIDVFYDADVLERLTTAEADIAAVEAEVDVLQAANLITRVGTAETEIDALQGGLGTLDGRVNGLAQDIVNIQIAAGTLTPTDDDLSTHLIYGAPIVVTALDTLTGELTVPLNHNLASGMAVYVATAAGSLAADSIWYVVREPSVHDKIKLAAAYDDAMAGMSLGLAAGTTPTLRLHRDPTQRIVNVLGRKKDGSEGGAIIGPLTGRVTPVMFGASVLADDNSRALQAFIDWIWTSVITLGDTQVHSASGDGEKTTYRHTRTLRMAQIRARDFICQNLSLHSACAGEIALDCSGMNTGNLSGLQIEGDAIDVPTIGRYITRVHFMEGLTQVQLPMPSASENNFSDETFSGYFSVVAALEINSDLNKHLGSIYSGRGGDDDAGTVFACASQAAVARYFNVAILSPFYPVAGLSLTPADIGTLTHVDFSECNMRRPFEWRVVPTDIDVSATPIILTFASGALADVGITGNVPVYISPISNDFSLKRGRYWLKNGTPTTRELWGAGGAGQVNHLTAGIGDVPVSGTYVTPGSSARITSRQNAPLIFCGPLKRPVFSGYLLGYDEAAVVLDLTDGDITGPRLSVHAESGGLYTFDVKTHATELRRLENADLHVSGDLIQHSHFFKRDGGIVKFDGALKLDSEQPGTNSIVLNNDMHLFGGDLANLHVNADLRITKTDMMANAADIGLLEGRLFDGEAWKATTLPSGPYTPVLTPVTNIDSVALVAATTAQFTADGAWVDVMMRLTVDATAAGNAVFNVSLPIASSLFASTLVGMGQRQGVSTEQFSIIPDTGDDVAQVTFTAVTTGSFNAVLRFSYLRD